jgi:CBS-domain-containing membrane protein
LFCMTPPPCMLALSVHTYSVTLPPFMLVNYSANSMVLIKFALVYPSSYAY